MMIKRPDKFTLGWYKEKKRKKIKDEEIARELFVSVGTLNRFKAEVGWTPKMGNNAKGAWSAKITEEELLDLINQNIPVKQIAKRYNMSEPTIYRRIHRLEHKTQRKMVRRWTEEEDQFLRDHYGLLTSSQIGEKLNRRKHAIKHRAKRLGIQLEAQRYTVYQGNEIIAEGTAAECAKKLGVSQKYIHNLAMNHTHKRIENYVNPENARIAFRHVRRQLI